MSTIFTFKNKSEAKENYVNVIVWKNVFPLVTLTLKNNVDQRMWKITVSGFASLEDLANVFINRNKKVVKCNVFPALKNQDETYFKVRTRERGREVTYFD